jgi:hypothetical protein
MKTILVRLTVTLAMVLAFTAVSAHGQGFNKRQAFVIPFEFSVGDKVFPAGEYRISREAQIVRVQTKDGMKTAHALLSRIVGTQRANSEAKLMFKHYGNQYQLTQIWLADGVGRELKRKRQPQSELSQNVVTVEVPSRTR